MIIATAKAIRPSSSAAAKPMNSPALLTVGRRRIAQRALKKRAEHVADAGSSGANADRGETGTDHLGSFEIHDCNSLR